MKYATTINAKTYTIEINDDRHITVDGVEYPVDFGSVSGQPIYSLLIGQQSWEAVVNPLDPAVWQVILQGNMYEVTVEDEREKRLRAASGAAVSTTDEFHLKAPMPGLIVAVPVAEGQAVAKGENLIILESMKMQNELKSPRAGTVGRVRVKAGDGVEQNQILVTVS